MSRPPITIGPRHRWWAVAVALGVVLGLAPASRAPAEQVLDAAGVDLFVRQLYFEGLPYLAPEELSAAAVDRLVKLLGSAPDAAFRANIVLALGMSEQPAAFAALVAFADRIPQGEVPADVYMARVALRMAFGHLARSNSDALQRLLDEAERDPAPTGTSWSFGMLHGATLARSLRQTAISGLGISGRREAMDALDSLATRLAKDPAAPRELRRHVEQSRAYCSRVRLEGPGRVFRRRQPAGQAH